jgi:hypothetical protein
VQCWGCKGRTVQHTFRLLCQPPAGALPTPQQHKEWTRHKHSGNNAAAAAAGYGLTTHPWVALYPHPPQGMDQARTQGSGTWDPGPAKVGCKPAQGATQAPRLLQHPHSHTTIIPHVRVLLVGNSTGSTQLCAGCHSCAASMFSGTTRLQGLLPAAHVQGRDNLMHQPASAVSTCSGKHGHDPHPATLDCSSTPILAAR